LPDFSASASRGSPIDSVQGTPAGSHVGPDLTHVASRQTIAAGTLPNTEASLEAWLDDPQAIKPGTGMPSHLLNGTDRRAVAAYLRTLR